MRPEKVRVLNETGPAIELRCSGGSKLIFFTKNDQIMISLPIHVEMLTGISTCPINKAMLKQICQSAKFQRKGQWLIWPVQSGTERLAVSCTIMEPGALFSFEWSTADRSGSISRYVPWQQLYRLAQPFRFDLLLHEDREKPAFGL